MKKEPQVLAPVCIRVLVPGVLFVLCAVFEPLSALATDRISLPPVRREVSSANGNYALVLSTPDNWKSPKCVAELFQVARGARNLLWTRTLPQELGPYYALVGNEGQVLFFDEWINVKTRYSVMLINPENRLVIQYDFDALQKILNVPASTIASLAKRGVWITSPPVLDPSNEMAKVKTGGKVLGVRLSDGQLMLTQ